MVKRRNSINYFDNVDIPVIVLLGAAAGWFLCGLTFITFMALFDTGEHQLLSPKALLLGALDLAISAAILLVTYLYWLLIPKMHGIVFPRLTGFAILIAAMSFVSAVLVSISMYYL